MTSEKVRRKEKKKGRASGHRPRKKRPTSPSGGGEKEKKTLERHIFLSPGEKKGKGDESTSTSERGTIPS